MSSARNERDLDVQELIQQACAATKNAYIPYSNYPVGAALLAADGTVYTGCNVENASFPVTICAERVALVKAVSEGVRDFSAIAVVTRNAGSPCGMCRQMLFEFAPQMRVIIADMDGNVVFDDALAQLLPLGFTPNHLDHAAS
ncbi:cytidine deaminase [Candidatus Flexifilum breve]|uniref:cytidine deaminase n=1 Tax=Candidatus Flexifilum breve TaxID=3140694 RepID=UPI0031CC651D